MITVFAQQNGMLLKSEMTADARLPPDAVWIDLLEPTAEEERMVDVAVNVDAPTREEMQEIELSSRIYREGEANYLTVLCLYKADTPDPETTAITFIRSGNMLVTKRFAEPQAIRSFMSRAQRQTGLGSSADAVMLGIFDAIIDRSADILERTGSELDALSKTIFSANASTSPKHSFEVSLEEVLRRLGRVEDFSSLIRDSLQSMSRALTFLGQFMQENKGSKDVRQRIKTLQRDVVSLSEHTAFLAHKGNFLLDATLGLINIEQTKIIKIFSVAATVFLPPTLIASIYGMNFQHMPELEWIMGYPWALLLMILSAALPYWWFRSKRWL